MALVLTCRGIGLKTCRWSRELEDLCDTEEASLGATACHVSFLDFYGNEIDDISGIGEYFNLEYLRLGNNHLSSLEVSDKSRPPHSMSLGISRSRTRSGFPHGLTRLDLSNNKCLVELDVSRNKLSSLLSIASLFSLQTLKACDNRLKRLDGLEELHALTYVDARSNVLAREQDLRALSFLLALKHLRLADNPVASKPHYRGTCLHLLPGLPMLDGQTLHRREYSQPIRMRPQPSTSTQASHPPTSNSHSAGQATDESSTSGANEGTSATPTESPVTQVCEVICCSPNDLPKLWLETAAGAPRTSERPPPPSPSDHGPLSDGEHSPKRRNSALRPVTKVTPSDATPKPVPFPTVKVGERGAVPEDDGGPYTPLSAYEIAPVLANGVAATGHLPLGMSPLADLPPGAGPPPAPAPVPAPGFMRPQSRQGMAPLPALSQVAGFAPTALAGAVPEGAGTPGSTGGAHPPRPFSPTPPATPDRPISRRGTAMARTPADLSSPIVRHARSRSLSSLPASSAPEAWEGNTEGEARGGNGSSGGVGGANAGLSGNERLAGFTTKAPQGVAAGPGQGVTSASVESKDMVPPPSVAALLFAEDPATNSDCDEKGRGLARHTVGARKAARGRHPAARHAWGPGYRHSRFVDRGALQWDEGGGGGEGEGGPEGAKMKREDHGNGVRGDTGEGDGVEEDGYGGGRGDEWNGGARGGTRAGDGGSEGGSRGRGDASVSAGASSISAARDLLEVGDKWGREGSNAEREEEDEEDYGDGGAVPGLRGRGLDGRVGAGVGADRGGEGAELDLPRQSVAMPPGRSGGYVPGQYALSMIRDSAERARFMQEVESPPASPVDGSASSVAAWDASTGKRSIHGTRYLDGVGGDADSRGVGGLEGGAWGGGVVPAASLRGEAPGDDGEVRAAGRGDSAGDDFETSYSSSSFLDALDKVAGAPGADADTASSAPAVAGGAGGGRRGGGRHVSGDEPAALDKWEDGRGGHAGAGGGSADLQGGWMLSQGGGADAHSLSLVARDRSTGMSDQGMGKEMLERGMEAAGVWANISPELLKATRMPAGGGATRGGACSHRTTSGTLVAAVVTPCWGLPGQGSRGPTRRSKGQTSGWSLRPPVGRPFSPVVLSRGSSGKY
eukprot:jgi/Mesvir1/15199/Mv06435-RA.2